VSARAVALEFQLECPSCRTRLRVPYVYQANFGIGSFVLGLSAAWLFGAGPRLVEATFLLAFVFALFLGTTIVPLAPPRLEIR
jgi:hypothetical protein